MNRINCCGKNYLYIKGVMRISQIHLSDENVKLKMYMLNAGNLNYWQTMWYRVMEIWTLVGKKVLIIIRFICENDQLLYSSTFWSIVCFNCCRKKYIVYMNWTFCSVVTLLCTCDVMRKSVLYKSKSISAVSKSTWCKVMKIYWCRQKYYIL